VPGRSKSSAEGGQGPWGAHLGSGSGKNVAQGVQRRGPAAEGNRARVRGRGRGAPGSWTPQVDAGCSCGGSGGVSVARDAAAASNFERAAHSPAVVLRRIPSCCWPDSGAKASVCVCASRWNEGGELQGRGCSGAARPRRRRGAARRGCSGAAS